MESLVQFSFRYYTGMIRDDPCWTSRKNGLKLTEISSIMNGGQVYQ
jgi:hypothetical protein